MVSDPKSKCADCLYRGRHIYVVAGLRFERELMADFLSTHTGGKVFKAESLEAIPVSNQGVPYGQKMILVDTHDLNQENLIHLFSLESWILLSHNLIALFNILHENEIEKVALKNGVRGLLYSDDPIESMVDGVCAINSGEFWIPRRILAECLQENYIGKVLPESVVHSLSDREVELLRVLSVGASNVAIADRLCISTHTVKTHLHNIFRKINVNNRLEAVLWSKENI